MKAIIVFAALYLIGGYFTKGYFDVAGTAALLFLAVPVAKAVKSIDGE